MAISAVGLVAVSLVLWLLFTLLREGVVKRVRAHLNSRYTLPALDELPPEPNLPHNTHAALVAASPSLLTKLLHKHESALRVKPGAEKRISFPTAHPVVEDDKDHHHHNHRGEPKPLRSLPPRKHKLCVVYIHGWSACRQDCSPVPEALAESLQCPLFSTRLSGHGYVDERAGEWLVSHATPARLLADAEEAMHVGKQLGEKVLLVGFSTGGALATWLAGQPKHHPHVAGLVLKSPCFAFAHPTYPVLKWVRALLRSLPVALGAALTRLVCHSMIGEYIHVQIPPENTWGTLYWTMTYPSVAIANLLDVVWQLDSIDFSKITVPTMIIANPQDNKVSYGEIVRRFNQLGATSKLLMNVPSRDVHVVCGHILSPCTTDQCTRAIVHFVANHVTGAAGADGAGAGAGKGVGEDARRGS